MKELGQYWKKKSTEEWLEILYLSALALYIIRVSFDTTMFFLPWPWYFDKLLRIFAVSVVLLRIGYGKGVQGWEWMACICAGAACALSWVWTGYDFLIDLAVYMVGAFGVSYKKLLKVYFYCGIAVFITAISASLMGVAEDLVYYNRGKYKHSFGIVYTTDFAAHAVYLALAGWLLYDRVPAVLTAGIMAALSVFVNRFSGAHCGSLVLAAAAASVLFIHLSEKEKGKKRWLDRALSLLNWLQNFSVAACAVFMITLSWIYSENNLLIEKINLFLTGRLRLAKAAFQTYGVKLFGTAFDMVGNGGGTIKHSGYNFVDSSYCLILVRYGLITMIAVCLLYFWEGRKARRRGNQILLAVITLTAVHSMIEHHFLEIPYNFTLLLPFSRIAGNKK